MPLLERNIDLNKKLLRDTKISVDCQPLDWSDDSQIEGVHVLIVSDCTYNPTYFKPLCKTIQLLLEGGNQPTFCLLAKKHRHSDEEGLWLEMKQCKISHSILLGQQAVEEGQWGMWKLTLR